ncbi:MAG: SPOR domain-containing protein [Thermoanaerobaculia bacterium]
MLGFDPDGGAIAFVDDKGLPRRLDLRASEVRLASRDKLSAITSADGSEIYGVDAKGQVQRLTPSGDWTFKPPSPARWVFPQPHGSAVVAGTEGSHTRLWLIHPTDDQVAQTASLPLVSHGVRTQIGDRLYFTVDSGLIGVTTRDLTPLKSIRLKDNVVAIVPTPSGDRLYVAVRGSRKLTVIDRYTQSVEGTVSLPGEAADLRMDPLGQGILVRPAGVGDSAWVVGVGDERVQGTIETAWRDDLPAYAPGSAIATVRGSDVTMVNAVNLRDMQTIEGGAADFWYFISWNGFRPRAADLDRPVSFGSSDGAPKRDSGAATADSANAVAPNPPIRDTAASVIVPPPALTPPHQGGYIVSFAAVLTSQKATELAAGITVGGAHPRVSATQSGTTTIYRVVMGPYATREEAERVGRDSKNQYWVYEGSQ